MSADAPGYGGESPEEIAQYIREVLLTLLKSGPLILALAILPDSEGVDRVGIVLSPGRPAPGEVVFRVYDDLLESDTLRRDIREALALAFKPPVEGLGQISITPASLEDRFVIGTLKPRNDD